MTYAEIRHPEARAEGEPRRIKAFDAARSAQHSPSQMTGNDFEAARLTVRLGAVAANYRACQRLAGPAAVAGVVKADAYGLGVAPVAPALAAAGCDTFFVARLEEGVALRAASCRRRASSCWTARRPMRCRR